MRRTLHALARAAFAVSLVWFGYALNDVDSGLGEIPGHWWSSGAAAAVVATGLTARVTGHRSAGMARAA